MCFYTSINLLEHEPYKNLFITILVTFTAVLKKSYRLFWQHLFPVLSKLHSFRKNRTTHQFNGHFPGEPGSAGYPLDNIGCWSEFFLRTRRPSSHPTYSVGGL